MEKNRGIVLVKIWIFVSGIIYECLQLAIYQLPEALGACALHIRGQKGSPSSCISRDTNNYWSGTASTYHTIFPFANALCQAAQQDCK